jgi:hypothetical protein
MLAALQRDLKAGRGSEAQQIRTLTRELDELAKVTDRLYEAVEKGIMALDASLQERVRNSCGAHAFTTLAIWWSYSDPAAAAVTA